MKSRIYTLLASLGLLLHLIPCHAQAPSLSVSLALGIIDWAKTPNTVGYGTNPIVTGAAVLSPISLSHAEAYGSGRASAKLTAQAGNLRCWSTGGFDYFVPAQTDGGYMECSASARVEDFLTVSSTTLPPGTIVTLTFTLSVHGTVSAPADDQRRPGITADVVGDAVMQTTVEFQHKTLSHLQGTLGSNVFKLQAKVGETFRMLHELEADTYLSSSIADYRDLVSDGYTGDLGCTLSLSIDDPANVTVSAASGYDYTGSTTKTNSPGAGPIAFITETDAELAGALDANGDGQIDYLLIDKATGLRQLGLQQPDGSLQWAEPASTGVDTVTGLGVGRFGNANDGFAVAAPLWNQVAVFADAMGDPAVAPTTGIGPAMVVGINFGGDATDDLAIGTLWDKGDVLTHLSGLIASSSGFNLGYGPQAETGALSRGNRAQIGGGPSFVGAFRDGGSAKDFVLRTLSASLPDGPTLPGLAPDTEWAWGQFQTNDLPRFLFYTPGSSNLNVPAISGSGSGPFSWGAGSTYAFPSPISRITVVPAGSSALLLILFDDGKSAATYDFDGNSAPVLRQSFTAPAGLPFSTAGALAGGDFVMLGGANGPHGSSSSWQHWGANGSQHKLVASGSLPPLTLSQTRANVLLFDSNPDLSPTASLLKTLRVGQWSDSAAPAGGKLHVTQEQFLGSATGLGSPASTDVAVLLSGYFPAVNQRAPLDTVAVLAPPTPVNPLDVSFSPPAGTYQLKNSAPLAILLSAASNDPIQYRTNSSGHWTLYDPSQPPLIAASTVVQAFVDAAAPGPIRSASYVIANAPPAVVPSAVDANHNGLPDSWEKAFGVSDPQGDPDGDGATNLQEYLAGTDPLDPSSKPDSNLSNVTLTARLPGPAAPVGTLCEIAWPGTIVGAVLEAADHLSDATAWANAGGSEITLGPERIHYEAGPGQRERYFRLRIQP